MTPNERLAAAAEMTLAAGTMSWTQRREDHVRYLTETFGDGLALLRGIATTSPASTCAVCVGMWAMLAGVQAKRARPRTPAITTWAGFGGFGGRYWIPRAKLTEVRRGDVLYWCGGTDKTWPAATNGHVGVALRGDGHVWTTAEGGGGGDGTTCRVSPAPKDIRSHSSRLWRGVWRADGADSNAAVPAPLPLAAPTWRDIAPGMRGEDVRAWQLSLLRWRPDCLPKFGADGAYGTSLSSETLLATRAFQAARGLAPTGIVDPQTWDAGEPA